MPSAPEMLGIRVRTPKFSLAMSTLPRAKSLAISMIMGFTRCQNRLKKATGKPSSPEAMSTFILASTASISYPEKAIMGLSFSSSDTFPDACQKEEERRKRLGSPAVPMRARYKS
jgi:hypothetical protein